jgi:hypothetical protein
MSITSKKEYGVTNKLNRLNLSVHNLTCKFYGSIEN